MLALLQQDPVAINLMLAQGGHRFVTPDPDRRIVDRATTVSEHFTTTGTPVSHGFTADNLANATAYYTFDIGRMRGIVLDTVVSSGPTAPSTRSSSPGSNASCRPPAAPGWLPTAVW